MCQKLWKLDDSRQSYCKNYLAYFFWPTLYIALMPPSVVKYCYIILLHRNRKASSRSCFTSKAKINVASDLSTSLPFNRFWKWFEGVVFQTGYEMFSYTFDSEVSYCAKSMMLPNDRDPSQNGSAHYYILLLLLLLLCQINEYKSTHWSDTEVKTLNRLQCTGWAKKVSLIIFAITLSTASEFS